MHLSLWHQSICLYVLNHLNHYGQIRISNYTVKQKSINLLGNCIFHYPKSGNLLLFSKFCRIFRLCIFTFYFTQQYSQTQCEKKMNILTNHNHLYCCLEKYFSAPVFRSKRNQIQTPDEKVCACKFVIIQKLKTATIFKN